MNITVQANPCFGKTKLPPNRIYFIKTPCRNAGRFVVEGRNYMPIYKRCCRCGKRIPSGSKCQCSKERHKEYDRFSRDKKSKDFYGSKDWEKAREDTIELDEGIDVYVYMTTGEILAADTAHHIIPLKDDWGKRIDIGNLMSLNHETHSEIEQRYRKDKEKIIKELQDMLANFRTMKRAGGI